MKARVTPAYTSEGTLIYVPEIGMEYIPDGCTKVLLRGHKYTCAVKNQNGQYVGWTNVDAEKMPVKRD